MRRKTLSFWLFLALAIAAMAAAPGSQGQKTVPRDISGVMDGRFTFEPTGPGILDFIAHGDTKGTMRHLGLSKMYTTHTLDENFLITGTFRIVAANGDEIYGTYTATAVINEDFSGALGEATLEIEGGTGRFANASGMIEATFVETFDDPTFAGAKVTWTLTGTVNY